ncbi:XdhC family protein [Saccharopolyspora phatthalungensis]|uniref:Xanthine/CO dehydrogenase XdhC/CoxF family maturation factor n=1 Tax=Saccharopolyspora phatthalungensis TaxID=664693 RepID=A0A840QAA5_9PSEU|nr:XdhC family protein [Saccharopolyspora phatthalungensis]MBB5157714.1 xanthine/CO dehydrogenase XdhC/CoxF family maturation factor [Saccharopolyspora phatthalungensis]
MTEDAACAVAHGEVPVEPGGRTLAAVFASPVAEYLLRYGRDLGFRPLLIEPDAERAASAGPDAVSAVPELDADADVVVTDHHRAELGPVLREVLKHDVRWVGIMGNPRHVGPHVAALQDLGVPDAEIKRVHRPIGLNIGSRTPPEIAIATLAGLLADRNGKPGGFAFPV